MTTVETTAIPRLPDHYPARPSDECDLIMKGGISSGVVYPRAACALATRYTFRSVGGTSAGAIAAAAVAAAEHGRESGGFEKLAALPDELGGTLSDLFQPSPGTRRAFDILSTWLELPPQPGEHYPTWWAWVRAQRSRRSVKAVRSLVSVAIGEAWWFFATLALLLAIVPTVVHTVTGALDVVSGAGWVVIAVLWVPCAVTIATLVAAVAFARSTSSAVAANGYGLCDGHTRPYKAPEPLTDWMQRTFDELAGRSGPRSAGYAPLTIGDLWGPEAVEAQQRISEVDARGGQVDLLTRIEARRRREVDLVVMTTNLTFQRPYRFPFTDDDFLYCARCLDPYVDGTILEHLERHGRATEPPVACPDHPDVAIRHLPEPWDIPVVLAARISLSFPGLISAVPLVALTRENGTDVRVPTTVWFSDGGMSSNFPMHVFDAPLPDRPTFGINLTTLKNRPVGAIVRPTPGSPQEPLPVLIDDLRSFGRTILGTMQNWVDNTQITIPGYSERIVTICQGQGQGGMNLKMPPTTITALAELGQQGGFLFNDFDLDRHKWTRYRVAMPGIDDILTTIKEGYEQGNYCSWLPSYAPTPPAFRFDQPGQVTADLSATDQLLALATTWARAGHPNIAGELPTPKPALRFMPRQ